MTEPFDPAEPTLRPQHGGPSGSGPDPADEPAAGDFEHAHVEHEEYGEDELDYADYEEHDEFDADEFDEHDDYVEIRPARGGCAKLVVAAGILVVLALVAVGGGWFWYQGKVDPSGAEGAPVAVEIPQGSTSDDIGTLLADDGVISSARVWGWYLRLNGGGPFQAGRYELPTNSAMSDVVALLEAGPAPPESDSFTVPEAYTVDEIVARMSDPEKGIARWSGETIDQLLTDQAITSRTKPEGQASYEGMLFPDTYQVGDDEAEQQILQRMSDLLDVVLDELEADEKGALLGLNRYEVVILASLIEDEARIPADQAKISRVIHNRLEQGIPLGIDATSRYEAVLAGRDRGSLDFNSDSPYNTRRHQGLPPTPITAPGRTAIEAALNPEPGPWTFYVLADEEGNHFFTDSNKEFLAAKRECEAKGLGCG